MKKKLYLIKKVKNNKKPVKGYIIFEKGLSNIAVLVFGEECFGGNAREGV